VATATPTKPYLKAISQPKTPLVLWHLLSFDAPSVAALWTWFIASANHVRLPISSTLAMATAVWMLYAADRLMDARLLGSSNTSHEDLEARHYFHHRHRTAFLFGILTAAVALAMLLPRIEPAAIHRYLILGGLLSGYFILIHATRSAHRLPKEIAVGLFFAAATFIPTIALRPGLRISLFPAAILFATLCSLNCLFIYAWEHDTHERTHAITRIALKNPSSLTVLLIVASIFFSRFDHQAPWAIPGAIAISATLLLILHHGRRNASVTTLRAAADLALLTPLLLLPCLVR
jgi:hypothetical protein